MIESFLRQKDSQLLGGAHIRALRLGGVAATFGRFAPHQVPVETCSSATIARVLECGIGPHQRSCRVSSVKTVFMFSGQGSHHLGMARELFETNDLFRGSMLRLDALAQMLGGEPVIEALYCGSNTDLFDRTLLTHPAIFMVEYSLAQCLIGVGVEPDMTLGASLGSFAAATVAGCLDVEDAMRAVMHQAFTFEARCVRGGMIAILADPALYSERFLSANSELAGVNFPSHFAVSARHAHLADIEAALRERGITHQRLAVSFAFHSRWIDEAQGPLAAFMRSIQRKDARLPVVCCARAEPLADLPEDFFWQIVRQPIRFRDTIARLECSGAYRYIDVGPGGTLATFVKYGLPAGSRSTTHPILTPYGQDQKNLAALLATMRSAR
jgi:acyl transferase domain-containing protein